MTKFQHPYSKEASEYEAQVSLPAVSKLLPALEKAAQLYDVPVAVLAAIASRETGGRNVIGDGGHGHGPLQIDDRSYTEWCTKWKADGMPVEAAIMKGAEVLVEKYRYLAKKLEGRTKDEILRATIAAFNTGQGRVAKSVLAGKDPDATTAHGDYSKDVLQRAAFFESKLNLKDAG